MKSIFTDTLVAYRISDKPINIRPGVRERDWMDAHPGRHPYKCLPMPAVNEFGWDLSLPFSVEMEWTGGAYTKDIVTRSTDPAWKADPWVISHFAHGIVTFDTGYLFRTPPGWQLLVQGPPNVVKDGLVPVSGLVESDWLPYPFTMNWHFTRPGTVSFARGEPFCRLLPVQIDPVRSIAPVIKAIDTDPVLREQMEAYSKARFVSGQENDGVPKPHGYYIKGFLPGGKPHQHRLRYDVRPFAEARVAVSKKPLLSTDECNRLISAFEANRDLWGQDDVDAYGVRQAFFDDRILTRTALCDREPEAAALLAEARDTLVSLAEKEFGLRPLGDDGVGIVVWPQGSSMPEHMDNCNTDPAEKHRTPHREIAAVVYLNDDFEGGETTFSSFGISVAPKAGHVALFPADRTHPHGVSEVTKGKRYTVAMWLTRDRSQWAQPR